MKSKEKLNALKEGTGTASKKLPELTDEELGHVSGGAHYAGATGTYKIRCSTPGCYFNLDVEPTAWDPTNRQCPICKTGTLSFDFEPYEK